MICPSLEWPQISKSVLLNPAVLRVIPFKNNPKDLGLSYKTDLDFWDYFFKKTCPSYNRRSTVLSLIYEHIALLYFIQRVKNHYFKL